MSFSFRCETKRVTRISILVNVRYVLVWAAIAECVDLRRLHIAVSIELIISVDLSVVGSFRTVGLVAGRCK